MATKFANVASRRIATANKDKMATINQSGNLEGNNRSIGGDKTATTQGCNNNSTTAWYKNGNYPLVGTISATPYFAAKTIAVAHAGEAASNLVDWHMFGRLFFLLPYCTATASQSIVVDFSKQPSHCCCCLTVQ